MLTYDVVAGGHDEAERLPRGGGHHEGDETPKPCSGDHLSSVCTEIGAAHAHCSALDIVLGATANAFVKQRIRTIVRERQFNTE